MIYIRNPTYPPKEGETRRAAFDIRSRRCGALISRRGLGFQLLADQPLLAEAGRETAAARRA